MQAAVAVGEFHPTVQEVPLVHPVHHQPHTPAERSTDCTVVADSPPIL